MELLTTLYRDETLVAIDKPSGLLVHRSRVSRDHVAAVQLVRDQLGRFVYPVHRLDRPTSGVLVFALDPDTAARLKHHWDAGEVHKRYLAIVRGWPSPPSGRIDWALRDEKGSDAREAQTDYRVLQTAELALAVPPHESSRYALVDARPITGRLHQIRKHLKHIAHPVIGDTAHGDRRHNDVFREHFDVQRLMLLARTLEFPHPHTGGTVSISAPLPDAFKRVHAAMGWPDDESV